MNRNLIRWILAAVMILSLNRDGTAAMTGTGSDSFGTWTADEAGISVTIDGSPVPGTEADGILTMAMDGMSMTLNREAPAAPFTPAEAVPAADVSAFAGTWKAAWLCGDGMMMAADSAQALSSWEMLFGSADQAVTVSGTHAVYFGHDEDFVFANGRLENLAGPVEGLEDTGIFDKIITLRADGMLCLQVMGFEIYMVPDGSAPAAPASVSAEGGIAMDVRYTAVQYTVAGVSRDASMLGAEYAVVFHSNATVDFTMAGFTVSLPWSQDGTDCVIDFSGNAIRCKPNGEGLEMDYLGTMLLQMNP